MIRALCAGAFVVATAGCALAPEGVPPEPSSRAVTLDRSSYRLGSGDKVRIDVYGETDLSIETLIEATGTINYPLLGRVVVQGYTLKDIEQLIAQRLADGYLVNPSVRAVVVQFRPFYVTGQVRRVGAYPYIEGLTVEKAIALAGGITEIASVRKMYILRDGLKTSRERVTMQTLVLPGDTIMVDESLF